MRDPRETGRPLDEYEAREFERLVAAFSASPARVPPAPGASEHRPLTVRQVVLVLTVSAVFAGLTATLPSPVNLWAPVVVLVALSLSCVVWGRLAERRRRH